MRWYSVRTVLLLALSCGVLYFAAPARAELHFTAPALVEQGKPFDVILSLTEPWPLEEGQVVDELFITLTFANVDPEGPSVLELGAPPATAGVLLDVPGASLALGEFSAVSFQQSLATFGPGELLRYHFKALSGTAGQSASITATVVPTMLDSQGLTELPPATVSVQVVPEPSTWLLLAAGVALLIVARMRMPRPARTPALTR